MMFLKTLAKYANYVTISTVMMEDSISGKEDGSYASVYPISKGVQIVRSYHGWSFLEQLPISETLIGMYNRKYVFYITVYDKLYMLGATESFELWLLTLFSPMGLHLYLPTKICFC